MLKSIFLINSNYSLIKTKFIILSLSTIFN